MNQTRKVQLLYQKAHGQKMDASPAETKELKRYKISSEDKNYATKVNITAYVKAVDNGSYLPFYDWCMNNHKADRRRKGSSEREMAAENKWNGIGAMMLGWLCWGLAVYWMFHGLFPVNACAIVGAVISLILSRVNRRGAGFTLFLLPLLLAGFFGR